MYCTVGEGSCHAIPAPKNFIKTLFLTHQIFISCLLIRKIGMEMKGKGWIQEMVTIALFQSDYLRKNRKEKVT